MRQQLSFFQLCSIISLHIQFSSQYDFASFSVSLKEISHTDYRVLETTF